MDLWKMWKVVTPREGFIGTLLFVVLTSFMIHLMVMLNSDRYVSSLLG
ncbi:MAG: light-harvesting protein [Rhodothalassiaceae bacterium]